MSCPVVVWRDAPLWVRVVCSVFVVSVILLVCIDCVKYFC